MLSRGESVAVLGAGNGGQAAAADLSLAGYQVNLYEHPSMAEQFKPILTSREIIYRTASEARTAKIAKATCDLEEAIAGVSLINVIVPATVHEKFFRELLPLLKRDQVVVVWSGRFGALRLRELCKREGIPAPKAIVEVNTLPYGSRLVRCGEVQILFTAKKLLYATVEPEATSEVDRVISSIYPVARRTNNPIAAALSNSALLVLPIASVLNVGGIEKAAGEFYLFRDGVTDGVARVMEAVYGEIKSIAEKLQFEITEYTADDFRRRGTVEAVNFEVPGGNPTFYERMKGPSAIKHRYTMENIPYGLVPISELGRLTGVPTPVIDAFIDLGSVLCETDFRANGRTLETLGIREVADIHKMTRAS